MSCLISRCHQWSPQPAWKCWKCCQSVHRRSTTWCCQVVSWFIDPSNYFEQVEQFSREHHIEGAAASGVLVLVVLRSLEFIGSGSLVAPKTSKHLRAWWPLRLLTKHVRDAGVWELWLWSDGRIGQRMRNDCKLCLGYQQWSISKQSATMTKSGSNL